MMGCQESDGGDVCKHIANSPHYTVETSTVLNSNDTPMKEKRKTLYVDVRLLLSVGFENSLHNLSIYFLFEMCDFQIFSLLACIFYLGFPVTQLVKNLPEMRETWVRSLGWEDPLEKGKATHSGILAWRIPWTIPWGHKESDRAE